MNRNLYLPTIIESVG